MAEDAAIRTDVVRGGRCADKLIHKFQVKRKDHRQPHVVGQLQRNNQFLVLSFNPPLIRIT